MLEYWPWGAAALVIFVAWRIARRLRGTLHTARAFLDQHDRKSAGEDADAEYREQERNAALTPSRKPRRDA